MKETHGYLPVIVIRLTQSAPEGDDLRELAKRAGYRGLAALLDEHAEIEATRAIRTVGPEELLAAEKRARDSEFPPLHSLTSFWRLDCSTIPDAIEELIERLSTLPEIGLAYRQSQAVEAGPVMNPGVLNPLLGDQDYLDPAPDGIEVTPAWALVDGSGVGFGDVEKDWLLGHEDLAGLTPFLPNISPGLVGSARHGAAVLGVVLGRQTAPGIVGIAPGVTSPVLSTQIIGGVDNVAGAITRAALALSAGDVLLIEVQLEPDKRPAELENLTFTEIRLAAGLDIIVVEAAGNGSLDLATFPALNRQHASFEDSGAILVGGGTGAVGVPHGRAGGTNFGDRVDCYAWGENVATTSSAIHPDGGEFTGTGALAITATPETQRYTKSFGGTSAASAIVAGAALLVQDIYQQATMTWPAGQRLSPLLMRGLLKAFASSTAAVAGSQIGRMPNLGELVGVLGGVPDLYIRDDVGDTGAVPSAGAISISPDVVVSSTSVAPAAAFTTGGTTVELGQDNFVYVRVSNRSPVQADDAKVRVYWSEVSTLVLPHEWTPLNPPLVAPPAGAEPAWDALVDVPGNGVLVEAPEIVWLEDNLPPAEGHYCFVATVDHQFDPQPDTAVFSWNEFLAFIRNYNNVTWRNFNAVDLVAGASGAGGEAAEQFFVKGAPDAERHFDLEILQSCPDGVSVVWELPRKLFRQLDAEFAEVREPKGCRLLALLWPRRFGRVSAVLQPRAELVLPGVLLEKSARHRCRFRFAATEKLPEDPCTVAIRQLYDGIEVGRVTWELRAGRE